MGSRFIGTLSKLKYVSDTNAVFASKMLLGSDRTKTAKDARAMRTGALVQRKVMAEER